MSLQTKSDENWVLGNILENEGKHNHSAHHTYYSIFQLMKFVVLNAGWATEQSLRSLSGGSHNAVLASFYSNLNCDKMTERRLKNNFHAIKKVRIKADYSTDYVTTAEKARMNQNCQYIKTYINGNLSNHL